MVSLLEFQAKDMLRVAGIPVPDGTLVRTADDPALGRRMGGVCKAQVAAKNRAASGGIRFADDAASVVAEVAALLSADIAGHRAAAVLVENRLPIAQEWFVSIITDPWGSGLVLQVSDAGGSGVEDRLSGGARHELSFTPSAPPSADSIMVTFGWSGPDVEQIARLCADLCRVALARDLLLLEVNPLAITREGAAVVVDAHVTVDDAAEFRQEWVNSLNGDLDLVHVGRAWRRRYGGDFKVVDAEGQAAILNTGAGAGMLVMDELARRGIHAYNFSDIRAGSPHLRRERFDAAADLICSGNEVGVVIVNIHAGITDLRTLREDLEHVIGRFGAADLPTVVRLQGPYSEGTGAALAGLPGVVIEPRLEYAIDKICELLGVTA
ncbi:ATP-grasp domain-containing protein [Nocardia sp. NPDC049190]|uniref:ATP-grasp domain-containing protein n=1 Tax=Nocardia sp. NPDC049190 TaxID=3155650 RepID=UPI0033C24C61